jgi:hypothetical protein
MAIEAITHYEVTCDECQDVLVDDDGSIQLFESEEEAIVGMTDYSWIRENEGTDQERVICDGCAENAEEEHEASKLDDEEEDDDE